MNYLQLKEAGFLSEDERTYSEDYYSSGNSLIDGVINIKNKVKNWATSSKTKKSEEGTPDTSGFAEKKREGEKEKEKLDKKIERWKKLRETKKMHSEIKQKREEYENSKLSQQKKANRLSEIKSNKESFRNTNEGKARVHDIKSRALDRSKGNLLSSEEGKKHSRNKTLTTVGTTVGGAALGGGAAYLMTSKWRKELAALKLKADKTPEDLDKIKSLNRKIIGATAAGSIVGGVAGNRVGAHLGKKSTSKFITNKIGSKPEFKK